MQYFEVKGGKSLQGDLYIQGAKNEALQVINAVLLTTEKVTIHNIPNILDVLTLIDLLKIVGVKVKKIGDNSYEFQANSTSISNITNPEFLEKSSSIRGSVTLTGALLGRFKEAYLYKPGGDKIGRRKLDTHLIAFNKLGADFIFQESKNYYKIDGKNLKSNYLLLDEPSVTGTANVILLSVLLKGTTTIYNAACEPYIQQLCKMLNSMGAKIKGIGSNLLTIEGVKELKGTTHTILPDMIEVGSFIALAAMTNSNITIKNAGVDHLGIIPQKFKQMGVQLSIQNDDIRIAQQDIYEIETNLDGSIPTIYDHPWPGLTPDLLSVFVVLATQARGSVLIHQKMFESRLFFVDKLIDMGAKIILCDPHRAHIIGLERRQQLRGITMTSPDIRAGVALLIAAISAKGTSKIFNIEQIDRGYENIELRLQNIGANIKRMIV